MRDNDRVTRARRDSDELQRVHGRVAEINDFGAYTDLLDHIARKLRLAREEARMLSAESGR